MKGPRNTRWHVVRHTRRTIPHVDGKRPVAFVDRESKEIHLRTDFVDWRVLDHLIHEWLHVELPDATEAVVDAMASRLRKVINSEFEVTLRNGKEKRAE